MKEELEVGTEFAPAEEAVGREVDVDAAAVDVELETVVVVDAGADKEEVKGVAVRERVVKSEVAIVEVVDVTVVGDGVIVPVVPAE